MSPRLARFARDLGQAAILAFLWSLAFAAWHSSGSEDGDGAIDDSLLVFLPPAAVLTCWTSFRVLDPLLAHRGVVRRVVVALVLPPFGAVLTATYAILLAIAVYAVAEPASMAESSMRELGQEWIWIVMGVLFGGLGMWVIAFPVSLVMGTVHTAWIHVRAIPARDALESDEDDDELDVVSPADLLDDL